MAHSLLGVDWLVPERSGICKRSFHLQSPAEGTLENLHGS